jgi:hypothetical protein
MIEGPEWSFAMGDELSRILGGEEPLRPILADALMAIPHLVLCRRAAVVNFRIRALIFRIAVDLGIDIGTLRRNCQSRLKFRENSFAVLRDGVALSDDSVLLEHGEAHDFEIRTDARTGQLIRLLPLNGNGHGACVLLPLAATVADLRSVCFGGAVAHFFQHRRLIFEFDAAPLLSQALDFTPIQFESVAPLSDSIGSGNEEQSFLTISAPFDADAMGGRVQSMTVTPFSLFERAPAKALCTITESMLDLLARPGCFEEALFDLVSAAIADPCVP